MINWDKLRIFAACVCLCRHISCGASSRKVARFFCAIPKNNLKIFCGFAKKDYICTHNNKTDMSQATYTNHATNETYTLKGVYSLEAAWNLADFVCRRNNWNLSMFCNDVTVKLSR